ncbi:hypothetical protein, partial [Motilimonas pumila]
TRTGPYCGRCEGAVKEAVTGDGQPLTGGQLAERILEVAESLPGYQQWCRHQHEIVRLSLYWARCIELSNYYPYGGQSLVESTSAHLTWNQQQSQDARERIQLAVAQLLEAGTLPVTVKARVAALKSLSKVSSDT